VSPVIETDETPDMVASAICSCTSSGSAAAPHLLPGADHRGHDVAARGRPSATSLISKFANHLRSKPFRAQISTSNLKKLEIESFKLLPAERLGHGIASEC
jgi:hypothetical protein